MKIKSIASLVTLSLILSFSGVGCKKGLQKTTPLPGRGAAQIGDPGAGEPLGAGVGLEGDGLGAGTLGTSGLDDGSGIPQPTGDFSNWQADRATLSAETVYFDFDKSNIRPSEVAKLEQVAAIMKTMPGKALRVEGHCDERGTEEYNRALGERRALSAREYLVQLGLNPQWIETVSYGEDQPVDLGHDETAWSKNRRAEFIVLTAP